MILLSMMVEKVIYRLLRVKTDNGKLPTSSTTESLN